MINMSLWGRVTRVYREIDWIVYKIMDEIKQKVIPGTAVSLGCQTFGFKIGKHWISRNLFYRDTNRWKLTLFKPKG